ncbi:gluconate kinase (FGGY family) [Halopolyspora algeriensis]|uniref:Gluconate kinase (FGGY family) n=1 Tax=Halopolyspora algeriensis TaxID=1500506 RepID=A0A368VGJ4_9ACTN|nr:gluconokinase [Halopolyspora algeriensis]RCW40265.1 gluconate kinase (FGGY family) [Halopolyspora algeriensis]TQM46254.1 gluconate kinase (FGGY family) [Halopolyspora algeriensis]
MTAGASEAVVLGIDLGTTATKVVAATREGAVLHWTERDNELRTDEPSEAVQDAEAVRDAAIAAVTECVSWARDNGCRVEALSFSAAMHTLLGLDSTGKPATPAFNWADTRAADVARHLRSDGDTAARLHRTTGTPVHTQSVMVKLAWLTSERADLAHDVVSWCALKDFVVGAFVGEFVTEHSMASGSGLQDMQRLEWCDEALQVAGVRADQLPGIRAPTDILPLTGRAAATTGLPEGLPVVLGGGDGPLGNLGVGAVKPGVAGLSLGTSGALRVVSEQPSIDKRCRTFSYALGDGLWVIGGAVSNGAVVGQWAAETFGMDLSTLLDEALQVAPGADGLLALPYLLGERAPWWEPGLTASLIGLRKFHGRAEITRAIVEGVAQQLALVRDAVQDTGAQVHAVRATGGGFRSRVWSEVVAAALDIDLELAEDRNGSGLGAVLLGWRALGEMDSLGDAASLVQPSRTVSPDHAAARLMAQRRPRIEQVHEALRDLE